MAEEFDLALFESYREDNRREVKSAEGGLPQSLWETYSAMANTYGGIIICGVKERQDGTWFTTGMKDVSKLKKNLWNQLNDTKRISINLTSETAIKTYTVNDDVIIVIEVPAADRETKPVYINGDMFRGSYKRNNEGDYHCTEAEVRAMLRDQTRRTMDMKVLSNMELSDFDPESVKTYRVWFSTKHPDHAWTKLSDDKFLEMIGAASDDCEDKKLHPTGAGLLMFGKEYKITREYPAYFLDYKDHADPTVRWTDRTYSQSPDWSGNVFDFFTIVSRKLLRMLKVPFKLQNIVRVDETPLHNAVREALVNCLVNADYYLSRGILIDSYDDKIVMKNPGLSIVGKRQMLRGGDSEPRNANIMKMFNLLGYGEHAGSGVPDIFYIWNQAGYAEPTIEEFFGGDAPDKTIITLPLVEMDHAAFTKGHEKRHEKRHEKGSFIEIRIEEVLKLIREKPEITQAEISEIMDISLKRVRTAMEALKQSGRIYREGSDRKGKWIINE
ncbi:MAG: putative DNA binding domain-containing protein [Ruminococcus sp.]|uniref:RNA-binding domain-containing protein n=1 Tax=Ruminococcus sp. TaxID=41978 RepID=UPI0025D2D186|nr:RNA-binding domain-containing protein [Ruminococcus sp.]MBR5684120.1 putative DNA binding domain-containing protein [Ruminococcus sp.]